MLHLLAQSFLENALMPFQYDYMLKAIFTSGLIGLVCACLSCFIILKGWSLMGDALAHSIVPGVSLAYLAGAPFALGAFIAGITASATMGYLKAHSKIREDAIIGIVFTTFFAAGILLNTLFPSPMKLNSIVLGNILGIATGDILQMLVISAATLLILLFKWRDILLVSFDPSHARALGMNVKFYNMLLLTLLAATAIAALQTVGACLVVALLVTPGATAYLLTDRFKNMLLIASVMGALTSIVGAYASYFLNGSTGGCIVVLQTAVFLLALFFAPKHGIIAGRLLAQATTAAFHQQQRALRPSPPPTERP